MKVPDYNDIKEINHTQAKKLRGRKTYLTVEEFFQLRKFDYLRVIYKKHVSYPKFWKLIMEPQIEENWNSENF